MGNVVNLGRARKARGRQAAKRQADANALRHGQTKADKRVARLERARLEATVDGARRSEPESSAAEAAAPQPPPPDQDQGGRA